MNTEYYFPLRSTNITQRNIKTIRNEYIGSIRNLMIDTKTGQVSYVVVEIKRDFSNPNKKYLALPWEAFNFNTKEKDMVLINVSKEKLENAPGFNEDDWPYGLQHEFICSVHTYYGFGSRTARM